MRGELPAGWTACTLGDIVERIETGKSVKCDERPPQGAENGLVKISAVTWGEFDEQESKTLFDSSHLKPEEKIQLGDFLISRANTLELVGSCVMVKKLSKNLYLSDKVLRLVLPDEAKSWLLVCLRSQAGRKQIESLATGNQLSMRNISQQALREIHMPLPPLAEQTRIATKLDELLAQVDTLKARIDGIPALLKRFRQSVLAAAVSGRLTEEWRNGADRESDTSVPASWVLTRLDKCVQAQNGKAFPSADYRGDGVRLIRPGNLHVSGHIVWSDSNTVCLDAAHVSGNERYLVRAGDIIMNLTAQSLKDDFLGRVCIYADETPALLNQRQCVFVFEDGSPLLREYLFWYFRSPQFRELVDTLDSGSLIKHMYTKQLAGHEIAIPTIEEQTEIVRRVEQLFAFADQLEAKVNEAKTRIDRLTQSILAKAFRGELVPQDPNDEPASALLERIQAQRASAPKARRKRRVGAD